jgi:O-antigen/teichoic acid export membrane protein
MSHILAKLPNILKDHLYRNSLYLVLSRLLNVTAGFLFWVIAAKLYSINEVGMATALISSLGLIMLFSRFGFDYSLIRYVANADKNKVFNTSLVITTIAAVVISLIYILLAGIFKANLALNLSNGMLFIRIALFNSITLIAGNMFLALRKGQYLFIQTVLISLRLFLLLPLARFESFGIILSLGICYVFSAIFSLWVLRKEVKVNFLQIDRPFVKESFKFSLGSYLSNILIEAPILILPVMVLHLIGRGEAAIYYIAMAIGNFALIVPYALSFSLFIEGSYGQSLKQNTIKACLTAYLFLIPIIVILSLWGKNILGLISKEYIEAYHLLFLVMITGFFAVIYMVFISVQNIKMRVERNIRLNLLRFLLLLGASYYLIPKYNISGVGYAWLLTHVILTLVIAATVLKDALRKNRVQSKAESTQSDKTPLLTLTTGPVVRDYDAYNLIVIILNTTCLNLRVKVVVNDLTEGRKQDRVMALLVQGNFTEKLTLPKPPTLYEVLIEGLSPGVYIWTSTSTKPDRASLQANKFIEANTFRHNDFISLPNI